MSNEVKVVQSPKVLLNEIKTYESKIKKFEVKIKTETDSDSIEMMTERVEIWKSKIEAIKLGFKKSRLTNIITNLNEEVLNAISTSVTKTLNEQGDTVEDDEVIGHFIVSIRSNGMTEKGNVKKVNANFSNAKVTRKSTTTKTSNTKPSKYHVTYTKTDKPNDIIELGEFKSYANAARELMLQGIIPTVDDFHGKNARRDIIETNKHINVTWTPINTEPVA